MPIPRLSMVSERDQEWESCPDCAGPFLATAEVCQSCSYSRLGKTKKAKAATFWFRVVPSVLSAAALVCLVQPEMNGVEFLGLFGFLGLCCVATTIGAGFYNLDKRGTFTVSFIAFVVVGFMRDSYGTSNEMESVGLPVMMVCYPVGSLIVFTLFFYRGDPDWFSFESSGGGRFRGGGDIGGGGGCGGGCGGGGCGGGGE